MLCFQDQKPRLAVLLIPFRQILNNFLIGFFDVSQSSLVQIEIFEDFLIDSFYISSKKLWSLKIKR